MMKISKHIEVKRQYFTPRIRVIDLMAEAVLAAATADATTPDVEGDGGNSRFSKPSIFNDDDFEEWQI